MQQLIRNHQRRPGFNPLAQFSRPDHRIAVSKRRPAETGLPDGSVSVVREHSLSIPAVGRGYARQSARRAGVALPHIRYADIDP